MKEKIHILGASGSGTTTIAKGVCDSLGYSHFDSDDYFWEDTIEPFTMERQREKCLHLMQIDLQRCDSWILSGSLTGWGEIFVPYFDLVVFVSVPQEIRMERLKKREYERYGDRVLAGGDRYEHSNDFINWAKSYDMGSENGRSLPKHEVWLKTLKCPVIRINNLNLEESIEQTLDAMKQP